MRPNQNHLKIGLLLTIVWAILAQFYFFYRREYVWDGAIFCGLAVSCFAWLLYAMNGRQARWPKIALDLQDHRRALLAGLALLLNLAAARSANTQPPPADYTSSAMLWLGSIVVFLVVFIPIRRPFTPRTPYQSFSIVLRRLATPHLLLVLGLLLVGLLLRLWDLEHIPANFSGDEGTQGMWAVDVLEGRVRNPFTTGWFTVPTMSFFAQAASLRLFGDSVAGLRTLSALIGTATLLFTYLLARREFGRRVAVFALAALTFNHYHIHFSRLASNQIADPFFMVLTLWLLTRGENSPRSVAEGEKRESPPPAARHSPLATRYLPLAGLVMGLSWYGYFGSRVIMLVVAAYLGMQALAERDFVRRHARALTLLALAFLMAASPLLLNYKNYPENLSARFNQVNFFRWLDRELTFPGHDSTLMLVWRQVWRSVSAFNHTLDPTFWYRAQIPLLDFVSGIFFILGLVVAIGQWRRPAVRLTLAWFALALTFGWVLTENPPSSMRMVIIAPAVALLVALGLDRLLTLARWVVGGQRAYWTRLGLLLMLVVAVLNVHYYFVVYTPTRVYGNLTAETSTVLARYLAGRDDQPFVYFYGPPYIYYDFGAIRFIARDVSGVSVPPKNQEPDYPTQVRGPTLFVVLGERLDELGAIRARHRNGRWREFYSEVDSRLMFSVYEVLQ